MSNTGRIAPRLPPASAERPLAHERITLHILIVIDGRIKTDYDPTFFGLGFIVDTLRANWSATVHIDLALATREKNLDEDARGGFEVYTGFRFHEDHLRIDDWDQIWIFADQPSESGDVIDADLLIKPGNSLSDDEVRLLAGWMDRGGGLFAAGDHNNLGAAVCHRIPRVRTMRRWLMTDGPPRQIGDRQNKTLQPVQDGFASAEEDLVLQPLELVYTQSVHSLPFLLVDRPHPILCSTAGPINRFPDHMHEGELVPDAEVQLDRPLDIPDYSRPEYPRAAPEAVARMIGLEPTIAWRPRPSIIAYGHTTNPTYFDPPDERGPSLRARPDTGYRRFGVVSVYDGDAANVGRIVCDSTWHHWFSQNLHALAEREAPAYRMMQTYYRNVAMWLAKITHRQSALTAMVWNVLTQSSPMDFVTSQTPWEMGERATEILIPSIGPCWVNELVASQFNATALYRISHPQDPRPRPEWSRLPEGLVNKAVIGSLAKSFYPLASQLQMDRMRRSGVRAEIKSIDALAKAGIAQVPGLLKETLSAAVASIGAMRESIDFHAGKSM